MAHPSQESFNMVTSIIFMMITSAFLFVARIKGQTISNKPNIIFMWFDDLGFADTGFNGGPYPTPVLDNLAAKSIKLNFHYCQSVCSPSRSSLYTGRYAWLSGLNQVSGPQSQKHVSRNLTFFSQLLQTDGYNTYLAGKWHIGYKYSDIMPGKKGFDEGIYGHLGSQYYERGPFNQPFATSYDTFYPFSNTTIENTRTALFGQILNVHDTWSIDSNGEERAILEGDTRYNEKIYTDGIVAFIDKQTVSNPFYIQYNLFTPHSRIVDPPDLNSSFTYQYDICNNTNLSIPNGKVLFCKSMLYAQERIQEIVDKVKSKGLWSNTLIVITSDNGPEPYGQTLPLRGTKSSSNEGGLRTATFVIGGYVENVLNSSTPSNTYCEYNEMVHISDWYHIFTDIVNITHLNADSDHNNLQIWDDIKCSCNDACNSTALYTERRELITMRLCGDNFSLPFPNNSTSFYATMIIKDGWKLIVNGSYGPNTECSAFNSQSGGGLNQINTWTGYDEHEYITPNQTFFDNWYLPQFIADNTRATTLYKSECLDALNGSNEINLNAAFFPKFSYDDDDEFMLFHLNTDNIEACNLVNAVSGNTTMYKNKINELLNILQIRSMEYNIDKNSAERSVGAMWEQINSYNCITNTTYIVPWNGLNEDKCGSEIETKNNLTARDCNIMWEKLNYIKQTNCAPTNSPTINPSLSPTATTNNPSSAPTNNPTAATSNPSSSPTVSTNNPSSAPSNSPTETTINPTKTPTNNPTAATSNPSLSPTNNPTIPSISPSYNPSISPTIAPTPTVLSGFVSTPIKKWQIADNICNPHLLSVTTESDKDIIADYLDSIGKPRAWIGLKKNITTNKFEWSDGTQCTNTNPNDNCLPSDNWWGTNEPGDDLCVSINFNGRFLTKSCDVRQVYFCSDSAPFLVGIPDENKQQITILTYVGLTVFVAFIILTILIIYIYRKCRKRKVRMDIFAEVVDSPHSPDSPLCHYNDSTTKHTSAMSGDMV